MNICRTRYQVIVNKVIVNIICYMQRLILVTIAVTLRRVFARRNRKLKAFFLPFPRSGNYLTRRRRSDYKVSSGKFCATAFTGCPLSTSFPWFRDWTFLNERAIELRLESRETPRRQPDTLRYLSSSKEIERIGGTEGRVVSGEFFFHRVESLLSPSLSAV